LNHFSNYNKINPVNQQLSFFADNEAAQPLACAVGRLPCDLRRAGAGADVRALQVAAAPEVRLTPGDTTVGHRPSAPPSPYYVKRKS